MCANTRLQRCLGQQRSLRQKCDEESVDVAGEGAQITKGSKLVWTSLEGYLTETFKQALNPITFSMEITGIVKKN